MAKTGGKGVSSVLWYLSVELVVAEVQSGVDGLEGLEINVDLLFLTIIG
jgi:hypothetical protein